MGIEKSVWRKKKEKMKNMDRRDFIKMLSAGFAVSAIGPGICLIPDSDDPESKLDEKVFDQIDDILLGKLTEEQSDRFIDFMLDESYVLNQYKKIQFLFVDYDTGNDANHGTRHEPLATLQEAVNRIPYEIDVAGFEIYVASKEEIEIDCPDLNEHVVNTNCFIKILSWEK